MKAHEDDPFAHRFRPHGFRKRDGLSACSYCGSVTTVEATRLLSTKGTEYSGSDWKYGYPHKFYLRSPEHGHRKFYTEHLKDATPEELAAFNEAARDTVRIEFVHDPEKGLGYRAPSPGFQTWGTV